MSKILAVALIVLLATTAYAEVEGDDFVSRRSQANNIALELMPVEGEERKRHMAAMYRVGNCSDVLAPYRKALINELGLGSRYDREIKYLEEVLARQTSPREIERFRRNIASKRAEKAEKLKPARAKTAEKRPAWMAVRAECYVHLQDWEAMTERLRTLKASL